MACADELIAEFLAGAQREEELFAALLDEMQSEDNSDDDAGFEETMSEKLLTKLCVVETKLCAWEARVVDVAVAEFMAEIVRERVIGIVPIESVPMIEIDVATAAVASAAAEAVMFARAVTAELSAIELVWWGSCDEKVVMRKDVVTFDDWMREWEAMVRWCGGGWWRRLLLIE